MDVTKLSDEQLKALIRNHEDKKAFDRPDYAAALDELQRRKGPTLELDRTIKAILANARSGAFITYGDVAKANDCDWSVVRRKIPQHLDLVLAKANALGAPLITAIVVPEKSRKSGNLEETSMKGFVGGAERLGLRVLDNEAFLRAQQQATFEYAQRGGTL
jgi:5-methylcytosine-specific restriction protein B